MKENGNTYYYIMDRLGNVRYVVNSSGAIVQSYLYTPFGQVHSSSGSLSQPYQYVGGEGYYTEETMGLQLLGQRWYDEEVGRFISRDPIGEEGGLNLYVYVGNNPLNYLAPSDLKCIVIGWYTTPWRDIGAPYIIGVYYENLPNVAVCSLLEMILGIPCKPGTIGVRIRKYGIQKQQRERKYHYLCMDKCLGVYDFWSGWVTMIRKVLRQWTRFAFTFERGNPIFTEWFVEDLWSIKE